jgi:hypothetical protein
MHSSPTRILAALIPAVLASQAPAETLNGVSVEVLARSTVQLPGGTVTFIRIRPPSLPTPPPAPQSAAIEPTAGELLTEARLAAKEHRTLSISAVTYQGSPIITELAWTRQADGRRFVAYSNVDFTHLTQLRDIETENVVYNWFPFVSAGEPAEIPAGVREALAVNGADPQYLFEGDEADAVAEASTLQALDFLIAYYQINKATLIAETARRKAEAEERERLAAVEAAKPKNETIYFWKNPNPTAR